MAPFYRLSISEDPHLSQSYIVCIAPRATSFCDGEHATSSMPPTHMLLTGSASNVCHGCKLMAGVAGSDAVHGRNLYMLSPVACMLPSSNDKQHGNRKHVTVSQAGHFRCVPNLFPELYHA